MLNTKLWSAIQYITTFISRNDEKAVYIAYSAGKDSAVVLDIVHKLNPEVPVIMNAFDSPESRTAIVFMQNYLKEKYPKIRGLITLPPKKQGFALMAPLFIGQFDGSRIAEAERAEKSTTFIEDGIEKNRKELKPFVDNGIWNTEVCYPIYDWTDKEVTEYILKEDLSYYG